MTTKPKTYFISGHMDLTQEEFEEHYAPRILEAVNEGASFVIGDALGCDWLAQVYLAYLPQEFATKRVTVYHMLEKPRNITVFITNLCGGFTTDEERDRAMTEASDDDIAWIRPGRRRNNFTAKNLQRRIEFNKKKEREKRSKLPRYHVLKWQDDDCIEQYSLISNENDKGEPSVWKEYLKIPLPEECYKEYFEAVNQYILAEKRLDDIKNIIRHYSIKQEEDPV